ncbi:hypothetical protein OHB12_05065 [Nocardia sp. NBC_01730]|uniref:hypothetical protein n=1 Tax=Nocardia sp. NBC_01730 TaxID=2975998 RepID=UPI002E1340B6|nr:hypothetical protein OHB12_05065 [Nocardia sp. NBC_01730]
MIYYSGSSMRFCPTASEESTPQMMLTTTDTADTTAASNRNHIEAHHLPSRQRNNMFQGDIEDVKIVMGESNSSETRPSQARPSARAQTRPSNEVPALVPVERVLVRTDDIAASLIGARAYSSGVELTLHVHVRQGCDRSAIGAFGGGYPGGTKDQFLVSVEFDDGKTGTNLRQFTLDSPQDLPVLSPGGGGGSDSLSTMTYYLTPLPPAGRLSLIVAWPAAGIGEHRTDLDAGTFRAAAQQSIVLWPLDPEPAPYRELPVELPDLEPNGWFDQAVS